MRSIEEMAREAGNSGHLIGVGNVYSDEQLARFAALVAEECAKVVEAEEVDWAATGSDEDAAYNNAIDRAALAIRERFKS